MRSVFRPDFMMVVAGFRDSLATEDQLASCPACGHPLHADTVLTRRYLADRLQSLVLQCRCRVVVEIYPGGS
jgi:hypothetical protein